MKPEYTDRWVKMIRGAQSDLVHEVGGVRRAGELVGRSTSEAGRWQSDLDFKVTNVAQAMILQADCGRPLLTNVMLDFMAAHRSGVPESVACATELSEHIADMMDHAGRIFAEAARAQADGHITPAEAQRLRRLCSAAAKFIAELDAMLAGVEAAGGISVVGGRTGGGAA